MEDNMLKISLITAVTLVPSVFWWLRRCWAGYKLAKDGREIGNVTSWL